MQQNYFFFGIIFVSLSILLIEKKFNLLMYIILNEKFIHLTILYYSIFFFFSSFILFIFTSFKFLPVLLPSLFHSCLTLFLFVFCLSLFIPSISSAHLYFYHCFYFYCFYFSVVRKPIFGQFADSCFFDSPKLDY